MTVVWARPGNDAVKKCTRSPHDRIDLGPGDALRTRDEERSDEPAHLASVRREACSCYSASEAFSKESAYGMERFSARRDNDGKSAGVDRPHCHVRALCARRVCQTQTDKCHAGLQRRPDIGEERYRQ